MLSRLSIKNYHPASEKIENKYACELLILYSTLFVNLNNIQQLNKHDIDTTVALWKIEHQREIQTINQQYVEAAELIANRMIAPANTFMNELKVDKLSTANDQMLNVTTEYIKQKFIELAVLEQNYNYGQQLSTEFLHSTIKTTEDKIALFTTMSTIGNVREFLFGNAESHGYTQYYWHTQRDNRVRPTHAAMDGEWVYFDQAPAITGYHHVSQDYNCRCYASKFR